LVATALAANLIGDAERAAVAATTRWPENASAWELVGRTAMAAGKTEEARAAFARAKQLDPGIATSVMEIR
jgi:cytochrome c-type biogenesis protein CcmH/NrfG